MILTFTSGAINGATRCLTIAIIEDSALEVNETFSVILTESDDDVNVLTSMTTVIIIDNSSELKWR